MRLKTVKVCTRYDQTHHSIAYADDNRLRLREQRSPTVSQKSLSSTDNLAVSRSLVRVASFSRRIHSLACLFARLHSKLIGRAARVRASNFIARTRVATRQRRRGFSLSASCTHAGARARVDAKVPDLMRPISDNMHQHHAYNPRMFQLLAR